MISGIHCIGKFCTGGFPRVTRSKLHLQLAQRLKAFCDPCEQELATELALHFEGGHDYQQAIRYLIIAAKNAARTIRLP